MTVDKLQPGSDAVKKIASEAMQRHHDHYARLEAEGTLSEEDRPNFDLAMQREGDDLVKPFIPAPKTPLPQSAE